MNERLVIGVDPGRQKCGLALVRGDGAVLRRAVLETAATPGAVAEWRRETGAAVAIGAGTGHRALLEALAEGGIRAVPVPERDTTRRARVRYFREHPPRGWRRLVPRGLLLPPGPVDDYAAALIAEAFLARQAPTSDDDGTLGEAAEQVRRRPRTKDQERKTDSDP